MHLRGLMNTSGWTVTSAPNLGREVTFEITLREVTSEITPREVTSEITPREVTFEIPLRVAGTTVAQTVMFSPASRMETHLCIQKDDN